MVHIQTPAHYVEAAKEKKEAVASAVDTMADKMDFTTQHSIDKTQKNIVEFLRPQLSSKASITFGNNIRWSQYKAPAATIIINVFEDQDVVAAVKYCNGNKLKFLAQSGGHGWASSFKMGEEDVIINMRGLNTVEVNKEKMEVEVGGGAVFKELQQGLFDNEVECTLGQCNTVGVMGAVLGGGLGRLAGMHGPTIDNLLSIRIVNSDGDLVTVNPTSHPDSDIWWAIKGAGHNFGIAVSATLKVHPWTHPGGKCWSGPLLYTPDKFGKIAEAISSMELKANMAVHFFLISPPPDKKTVAMAQPFYYGPEEEARIAFKPLLDLEPFFDGAAMTEDPVVNEAGDPFCIKGGYKSGMGRGLMKMDAASFDEISKLYLEFIGEQGWDDVGMSGLLIECYSTLGAMKTPSSSACYPHRGIKFFAIILPFGTSHQHCEAGIKFSKKARDILTKCSGLPGDQQHTYVNFANGDEPLEVIYGRDNLERLRKVKKEWDPHGKFNQFFPITY